jgi:putative tryptophan/tyrosine transport system permease protein
MFWLQWSSTFEMGLIYALVALGVYLTFRVIEFPDMTIDGTFTMGAAVSAVLMISHHCSAWPATLVATFMGAFMGCVTGYLNTRWHVSELLAGILTMTALYSVNLRIMGQPNMAFLEQITIVSKVPTLAVASGLVILVMALLVYFFSSAMGLSARAIINASLSDTYGIHVHRIRYLMLAISNGLVALAGSVFAQSQGFADISVGTGTLVMGLASVILGEAIFKKRGTIAWQLLGCVVGSIIYRMFIALALDMDWLGLAPSDLNLITSLLIASMMMLSKRRL